MDFETMDKEYVLQTYARNYVNFKHGINATLFDDKGRDYIDFTSGIGVVSVGHGNQRLADAIKKSFFFLCPNLSLKLKNKKGDTC